MENFTAAIEKMLNEKLSLYRQMNDLLKEEREFIANIDVDSLWKSAEQKKQIGRDIEKIRYDILSCLTEKLGFSDMDIRSFSVSHLIRTLPISNENKKRFRQMKLAIEAEKNELQQAAQDNKKYVREYLLVIDDIMSVAVDRPDQAQYSYGGIMSNAKASNCLIHAEV